MMKRNTILIVDDEIDFLSSMRRALRKEPYQLVTADSGIKALQRLKDHDICLVITDFMMPGMDGVTLIKRINDQYPHILSIMVTALSEIDVAMQAINEGGVYKFILKPIDIAELKATLRFALESLNFMTGKEEMPQTLKIKKRHVILQELEQQYPGITQLKCNPDDFILSGE